APLALLFAVALGLLAKLVLGDGFIRNSHAWSPLRRRAAGCHGHNAQAGLGAPLFPPSHAASITGACAPGPASRTCSGLPAARCRAPSSITPRPAPIRRRR